MHLTSLGRGLAVSAVTALTLTGLGAAPAAAEEAAPEGGVALLTPFNDARAVSARAEDPGREDVGSVRLVAEVTDPDASTRFEYHPDPAADDDAEGWIVIAEVPVDGGYAQTDWTPAPELTATSVALRAVAVTVDGGSTSETSSLLPDVRVLDPSPAGDEPDAETVAISPAVERGYFPQPYASSDREATLVSVSGSTSAVDGQVELSSWRSSTQEFGGRTNASVFAVLSKVSYGVFYSTLDIAGSGLGDGDTLGIGAERDTDHVETSVLYAQTLTRIQVSADRSAPTGRTGTAQISVADERGAGVVGAEVRRTSDDALVGYTDTYGQVAATQVGGTTESYYVNATDADPYAEAEGDQVTDAFTFPTYVQEASSATAYLADGTVFDRDEAAVGDVGVLVRDQEGQAMPAGTAAEYRLSRSGETPPETWETGTTDEDGVVPVVPGTNGADGAYLLEYRLPGTEDVGSTEFTVGQATLVLDPDAETVRTDSGGTISYSGRLAVGDVGLPDRLIDLEYLRGLELVPGRDADAGIETDDGLSVTGTTTTDGDGRFSVRVTDETEAGSPTESGGSLTVATGDTVATEDSTVTGDADEEVSSGTEFGRGRGSARIRRGASGNGAGADVVKVRGPGSVAGETVRVLRVLPGGGRRAVATRTLNADGDAQARVADTNGTRFTTYVVKLVPSRRVTASEAPPIRVR